MPGICFLGWALEKVVAGIGEGEKGGMEGERGLGEWIGRPKGRIGRCESFRCAGRDGFRRVQLP
jgi:hypothetical protein